MIPLGKINCLTEGETVRSIGENAFWGSRQVHTKAPLLKARFERGAYCLTLRETGRSQKRTLYAFVDRAAPTPERPVQSVVDNQISGQLAKLML